MLRRTRGVFPENRASIVLPFTGTVVPASRSQSNSWPSRMTYDHPSAATRRNAVCRSALERRGRRTLRRGSGTRSPRDPEAGVQQCRILLLAEPDEHEECLVEADQSAGPFRVPRDRHPAYNDRATYCTGPPGASTRARQAGTSSPLEDVDLSQDLSIDGPTSIYRAAYFQHRLLRIVRKYRFVRVVPNKRRFLAGISSIAQFAGQVCAV
jgi:hypothetical protein